MIELYTDGSAIDNPGPGGWGAIVRGYGASEKELSGCEAESTNNRMELMAVIQGLRWLLEKENIAYQRGESPSHTPTGLFAQPVDEQACGGEDRQFVQPVHIYTDSTYVQKGITEWMPTWLRRNWRRSKGGQLVKNSDLRKQLNSIVERFDDVKWSWVKAHVGHEYNERVDDLAREAAISQ